MQRTALISAIFALLVTVALGCGGSSEAEPTATKAQLVKRGDAICTKTDKKQQETLYAWQKKHPSTSSSQAWQEKILRVAALPPVKVETRELAALPTPTGDEAKIEAIVEGLEAAYKQSVEDPSPLLTGAGAFAGVEKLIKEYGFKACVNPL